jgi:hypothetical protein
LVASGADAGDSGDRKEAAPRLSLQTRIALIGVAGALAGTLAGGLVTWYVTQEQIESQRADTRRAERLDAYAKYFGDAARFWTQVGTVYEVMPRPKRLSESDTAALKALLETLTREYAHIALLAPDRVRNVARELHSANTDVWNALQTSPIDHELYEDARRRATGRPSNLQREFVDAAQEDLGTTDR